MDSILIIDDNPEFRFTVCDFLLDAGYDVWEAATPADAYKLLKREKMDLIVCDLHMPLTLSEDMVHYEYSSAVGIKTISELTWVFPGMPIVAMSAMISQSGLEEVRKTLGTVPVLLKPFHHTELLAVVHELIQCRESQILQ